MQLVEGRQLSRRWWSNVSQAGLVAGERRVEGATVVDDGTVKETGRHHQRLLLRLAMGSELGSEQQNKK